MGQPRTRPPRRARGGQRHHLAEALDGELDRVGFDGPEARVALLVDLRMRAGRRALEALDRFAATPAARAEFLKDFAHGRSLAADIARKRRQGEREEEQ